MGYGIRVVLVMNRKGGSGKSTLCRALASAAAAKGETVTIFDTDASKSCLKWMQAGKEAGNWSSLVEVIHTLDAESRRATLAAVRRHVRAACEERREPATVADRMTAGFTEDALLLGFARRFATYKRADLLLRDVRRLEAIINRADRPVRFLFAGKAHPSDRAGQDVALTRGEFEVLALLVRHPGEILDRDRLSRAVSGHDWSPQDRSVDVLVRRLRVKLDDPARADSLIATIRGEGYRLAVDVEPGGG